MPSLLDSVLHGFQSQMSAMFHGPAPQPVPPSTGPVVHARQTPNSALPSASYKEQNPVSVRAAATLSAPSESFMEAACNRAVAAASGVRRQDRAVTVDPDAAPPLNRHGHVRTRFQGPSHVPVPVPGPLPAPAEPPTSTGFTEGEPGPCGTPIDFNVSAGDIAGKILDRLKDKYPNMSDEAQEDVMEQLEDWLAERRPVIHMEKREECCGVLPELAFLGDNDLGGESSVSFDYEEACVTEPVSYLISPLCTGMDVEMNDCGLCPRSRGGIGGLRAVPNMPAHRERGLISRARTGGGLDPGRRRHTALCHCFTRSSHPDCAFNMWITPGNVTETIELDHRNFGTLTSPCCDGDQRCDGGGIAPSGGLQQAFHGGRATMGTGSRFSQGPAHKRLLLPRSNGGVLTRIQRRSAVGDLPGHLMRAIGNRLDKLHSSPVRQRFDGPPTSQPAGNRPTTQPASTTLVGPDARIISFVDEIYINEPDTLVNNIVDAWEKANPGKPASEAVYRGAQVAITELHGSRNPWPPGSFATKRAWRDFIASKEYRAINGFRPTIDCTCSGMARNPKYTDSDMIPGYTPIRGGQDKTDIFLPGEGISTQSPAKKLSRGCFEFNQGIWARIGLAGQRVQRILLGAGVPYAWSEIKYKLCCDNTYDVKFLGSYFPAHWSYLDFVNRGRRAQSRLPEFLFAGDVGSSRVDLQACKLEYSIVSPK